MKPAPHEFPQLDRYAEVPTLSAIASPSATLPTATTWKRWLTLAAPWKRPRRNWRNGSAALGSPKPSDVQAMLIEIGFDELEDDEERAYFRRCRPVSTCRRKRFRPPARSRRPPATQFARLPTSVARTPDLDRKALPVFTTPANDCQLRPCKDNLLAGEWKAIPSHRPAHAEHLLAKRQIDGPRSRRRLRPARRPTSAKTLKFFPLRNSFAQP